MAKQLVEAVLKKLYEYGIEVYNQYAMEKNSHVFMTNYFTLFLDLSDNSIGVSFHAATKPEYVANHTLIIDEIEGISRIDVMQSHAYKENKIVSGDEAFNLIQDQLLQDFIEKQRYNKILMSNECYKC